MKLIKLARDMVKRRTRVKPLGYTKGGNFLTTPYQGLSSVDFVVLTSGDKRNNEGLLLILTWERKEREACRVYDLAVLKTGDT